MMTSLYYRTLYNIVRRIVELKQTLKQREFAPNERQEIEGIIQQEQEALLQTVKELLYSEKPENLEEWPIIGKYYGEIPF